MFLSGIKSRIGLWLQKNFKVYRLLLSSIDLIPQLLEKQNCLDSRAQAIATALDCLTGKLIERLTELERRCATLDDALLRVEKKLGFLEHLDELTQERLTTLSLGVPFAFQSSQEKRDSNQTQGDLSKIDERLQFWISLSGNIREVLAHGNHEIELNFYNSLAARTRLLNSEFTVVALIGNHRPEVASFLEKELSIQKVDVYSFQHLRSIQPGQELGKYDAFFVLDPNFSVILLQMPEILRWLGFSNRGSLIISVFVLEGEDVTREPKVFSGNTAQSERGIQFNDSFVRRAFHCSGYIEVECIHTQSASYGPWGDRRVSRFIHTDSFYYVDDVQKRPPKFSAGVVLKTYRARKLPLSIDPRPFVEVRA